MKTIICGVDARLVAVHVLDRLSDVEPSAKSGTSPERLAAVARDEDALMIVLGARSRGRSRSFIRTRCAGELAELTSVPVLVAPLQLAATPTTPLNTAMIRGGLR